MFVNFRTSSSAPLSCLRARYLQVPLSDLQTVPTQSPSQESLPVTLVDAEREHILAALQEAGWVLGGPKGAAARLGMKRSTLHWKMQKLGITRPD